MIADAMVAGEYLKAAAIADTTPTYTIRSVSLEQLASLKPGAAEDKTVQKGVIWFSDTPLGWVMNKTNVECLKAVWGNDTGAWLGKRVTLRTEMTKTGLGIRMKGSPDIDREIVARVKLPKRKPIEYTIVPTGNRRPPSRDASAPANPYAAFTATLAAKGIDADQVAEWRGITHPDQPALDTMSGAWLEKYAAALFADGSTLMADFRKFAGGGGK